MNTSEPLDSRGDVTQRGGFCKSPAKVGVTGTDCFLPYPDFFSDETALLVGRDVRMALSPGARFHLKKSSEPGEADLRTCQD